jgi:heterodisulfide reductase subunit A-like polyferredoxin
MSRIGVFICHCGENIGATVDCIKVTELAANMEGVAYAVDYKYMCSDPGQTLIKNAIKDMIWMVVVVVHVLPVCMNRLFVGHVLKQP